MHIPHPLPSCAVSLNIGCAARDAREVSLAIMGDLHLEPAQMPLFHTARRQIRTALRRGTGEEQLADGLMPRGARVVQLGDLGGYSNAPGSRRASAPPLAALTLSLTVTPADHSACTPQRTR